MAKYGLVYIEESDQLFQHFARGGGGIYGSHVSDRETRAGFACLRDAFLLSGHVFCVDATMTQVTYQVADAMRGENRLRVVKNSQITSKPSVSLLRSREEAYAIVLRSLEAKKTVVVACDTAGAASDITETMVRLNALKGKQYLLITRETERDPRVIEFMSDVNKHAPKYAFIAYNSVMASGVSVTSVRPDVIVQIANYLTPRVNLQLLNRFRKQHEVFCFYQNTENLYNETQRTIMQDFEQRAEIEAGLVKMPLAARTDDAVLRFKVAAISLADVAAQNRSTAAFYIGLLKGDGRETVLANPVPTSAIVKYTLQEVRKAKKEKREYISKYWNTVPPIDEDRPAMPDMDSLTVAMGETHAEIEEILNGNVPYDNDPENTYNVVMGFKSVLPPINALLYQKDAMFNAENYLADSGRALTTLNNNVTMIKIVSLLKHLYTGLHDTLTEADVAIRAPKFLKELRNERVAYDSITWREREKYDEVTERSDDASDTALAFAKIILSKIGLKQRSLRAKGGREYTIMNAEDLENFIRWRTPQNPPPMAFTMAGVEAAIDDKSDVMILYLAMDEVKRKTVINLIDTERYTDFATAVWSVHSGLDKF